MFKVIIAAMLALAAPLALAAKCQALDGNWYPYDDPHCSPNRAPAKPAHKVETKTADAVMALGSDGLVKIESLILMAESKKLGEATAEQANACLERYRSAYKDPRSAYVVTSALYQSKIERFVVVDVSAKNGFGGNTRGDLLCSLPPE